MGFLLFILGVIAIFCKPVRELLMGFVGVAIIMSLIAAIPGGVILDIIGIIIVIILFASKK